MRTCHTDAEQTAYRHTNEMHNRKGIHMAKEQRTYNVTEYAEKARVALAKLLTEQVAGQVTSGGKTDVLNAVRTELKELMDKGYTTQQIADALKDDVFGILPKSITFAVKGKKHTVKRVVKPATKQADKPAVKPAPKLVANVQGNKPATADKQQQVENGSIKINKVSNEDL